ncbi:MAG TPA: ubiquinol-cytochrome C chaperone family protein [Methyloceanibacter sp.]|nr:ubiquinol-cytochrome C chaperone family protein [Methyloceanibacter sp.]
MKLDEMVRSLNPLATLMPWRRKRAQADDLYGAIVARARLPVFYQGLGVPDTLEGRFVMLSLHLFAVLHRLNAGSQQAPDMAHEMAQALVDRFTTDMDTVLRELGVSDLKVPKKVRGLAASGAALMQTYEAALAEGEGALTAAIASALPLDEPAAKAASGRLAPYVVNMVGHLDAQPLPDLCGALMTLPDA